MQDPIRPVDDAARAMAWGILAAARFGALGVIEPETGAPFVTRVAMGLVGGAPHILVSTLSQHTRALLADPRASLLLGEPGNRGDPLTHPRLTVQVRAIAADKAAGRADWLRVHPKAKLYYDFTDFMLLRLAPVAGFLNGGFGKAFRLNSDDLTTPPSPAPP